MKRYAFAVFAIAVLGVISYANSLGNDFVFDDRALVVKNEYIKDAKFIPQILTPEAPYTETESEGSFYRPIQSFSFLCDYAIWKLKPLGFHITNLLLHIFNAILVYLFILLLLEGSPFYNSNSIALITALLFVVHPIHTQAVSYISGRADLLGASFFLLSGVSFIQYARSVKNRFYYYLCSLAFFILGLLSKETVMILPLALLLYIWFTQSKADKKAGAKGLVGFFAVTGLYVAFRLFVLGYSMSVLLPRDLYTRILTFLRALFTYFRLLVFPYDLHIERFVAPRTTFFEPQVLLSALLLLAIWMSLSQVRKSLKPCAFGFLWFFVLLLPVSNVIIPLNTRMAEHWLYLPSIGFFLIFANLFVEKIMPAFKKMSIIFLIIILGLYSLVTFRQNTYWRDNLSLFKRALTYSPENHRLHNNLGVIYFETGVIGSAIAHFKAAIKLKPDYKDAYYNLGRVYAGLRHYRDAAHVWKEALAIDPDYAVCRQALIDLRRRGKR
jgi:tetratricopeptide (TPR) repeat protein